MTWVPTDKNTSAWNPSTKSTATFTPTDIGRTYTSTYLLKEDGGRILLESGFGIALEQTEVTTWTSTNKAS